MLLRTCGVSALLVALAATLFIGAQAVGQSQPATPAKPRKPKPAATQSTTEAPAAAKANAAAEAEPTTAAPAAKAQGAGEAAAPRSKPAARRPATTGARPATGTRPAAGAPATGTTPATTGTRPKSTKPATTAPASTGDKSKQVAGSVDVGERDFPQWMGSPTRNNTPEGQNIPTEWDIGEFNEETGEWVPGSGQNIKWVSRLGSQSYGNAVIANGQVYIGTNNGAGWLKRFPANVDLGVLLAFKEEDGTFLWQHSSEKLLGLGRTQDWPLQGICCAPLVEGERLWFVTSRGQVACLDTQGFQDDENDGPFADEPVKGKGEADVLWYLDMMNELGVSQHNMASCSVTAAGDILYVNTSNGVDESHVNLPAPNAPSFIAVNKNTGKVIWTDDSPGTNILHGQWSSPTYAVLGGVPQVLFGGGDGYMYSFKGGEGEGGKPELLWKFDCNPKESRYEVSGRATRNHIIATPVVHNDLVYSAVGEDPEHGEGPGHLWCIDPTKRGDVSPQLAFSLQNPDEPMPHKRIQAVIPENGEVARDNPNSAVVWHYFGLDVDGDNKLDFEEAMHRTCGSVAIKNDLLYIADFSGLVHCLDATTGKPHWTHDMLAVSWGSPMIVEDRVYIGDEDGDVTIFELSPKMEIINEINMGSAVYTTPVVANNVLYISNKTHLFAIAEGAEGAAPPADAPRPGIETSDALAAPASGSSATPSAGTGSTEAPAAGDAAAASAEAGSAATPATSRSGAAAPGSPADAGSDAAAPASPASDASPTVDASASAAEEGAAGEGNSADEASSEEDAGPPAAGGDE